jgi:hypothetical protein
MAKKKTVGPDTPAEQTAAAPRRRTMTGPRKRAALGSESSTSSSSAIPVSEPIDRAADMSVGAGSSDSAAAREPSYDEIAEAAYHRYLNRGGHHGQDLDDWVEAERTLRSRR